MVINKIEGDHTIPHYQRILQLLYNSVCRDTELCADLHCNILTQSLAYVWHTTSEVVDANVTTVAAYCIKSIAKLCLDSKHLLLLSHSELLLYLLTELLEALL